MLVFLQAGMGSFEEIKEIPKEFMYHFNKEQYVVEMQQDRKRSLDLIRAGNGGKVKWWGKPMDNQGYSASFVNTDESQHYLQ